MRRALLRAVLVAAVFAAPLPLRAQLSGAAAVAQAVDGLGVGARVLVVAAHPDDEDTQLIAWLARGRHVETAYLSLTRGDGGQNLIGNELGEALGVIRTEELLAARRVDGGTQYFTRAFDFGFSKSAEETFRHWSREELLRDVVTVVRSFRPHVIVSVFSGTPRDGHGHHQVAGILAREAYDVASDTLRFPRAATAGLEPWTPLKFYRGARFRPEEATLSFNVGEYDPVLGRSYAEIAAISRSLHRSQGFGALQRRGVVMNHVRREHTRIAAPADPRQERSIFDGIETTWLGGLRALELPSAYRQRLEGVPAALEAVRAVPLQHPDSLIPRLAVLRRLLRAEGVVAASGSGVNHGTIAGGSGGLPDAAAPLLRAAFQRASTALAVASGLVLEAEVERELVAAGDSVPLRLTVYNRGAFSARVTPEHFFSCEAGAPGRGGRVDRQHRLLATDSVALVLPDSSRSWEGVFCAAPAHDALSQPWWLTAPRDGSLFRFASVAAPEEEINRGFVLGARVELPDLDGEALPFPIEAPVVYRFVDPVRGDVSRPVAVVPQVSVLLDRTIEYAPASTALEREVRVELRSAAWDSVSLRTRIDLPGGLVADSAQRTVRLPPGGVRQVVFRVTGRLAAGRDTIRVVAEDDAGERYAQGYVAIDYEHIRPQRLYRPAEIVMEAVDVRLPAGLTVGYIPGVGDNSAPMLEQLGIPVTVLDPASLGSADLSRFTAVVVGPRAYGADPELIANSARLLDYARGGGTLVVQYGQYEMTRPGIMPYAITISRPHTRVTDEAAPVRVLRPDHPLLNTPNRIGPGDFEGWVQERSLYMPATFDPAYTALLAMSDADEPPHEGAILVAPYGRGAYVYTSLAFFRQLPAGVPGAARLFVNLLAARP